MHTAYESGACCVHRWRACVNAWQGKKVLFRRVGKSGGEGRERKEKLEPAASDNNNNRNEWPDPTATHQRDLSFEFERRQVSRTRTRSSDTPDFRLRNADSGSEPDPATLIPQARLGHAYTRVTSDPCKKKDPPTCRLLFQNLLDAYLEKVKLIDFGFWMGGKKWKGFLFN